MRVTEILDKDIDVDINYDNNLGAFFSTAKLTNGDIVNVVLSELSDGSDYKILDFFVNDSLELTNKGNALEVFNAVKESIRLILKETTASVIIFGAEGNRPSVYSKLLGRYGYKTQKVNGTLYLSSSVPVNISKTDDGVELSINGDNYFMGWDNKTNGPVPHKVKSLMHYLKNSLRQVTYETK